MVPHLIYARGKPASYDVGNASKEFLFHQILPWAILRP
jgi:hypothetical protein